LNLTFRISNGLQNVNDGEADVVCIAGMGVYTMIDILLAKNIEKDPSREVQLMLDKLGTQRLLLQPTNSKPRLLMHLYSSLYDMGWTATTERIDFSSSRWYISIAFERSNRSHVKVPIPGTTLATSDAFDEACKWISHHRNWIRADTSKAGFTNRDDKLWLAAFESIV
jgi:tRNA A22 N-methylase